MYKCIVLLLVVFFLVPAAVSNSDSTIPFLFSEDQDIKNTSLMPKIKKNKYLSKHLAKDKWINSPATRLELFVFMAQQYLQSELNHFWETEKTNLQDYFEPAEGDFQPIASSTFSYSHKNDLFEATITIDYLGKPKKPMKKYCKKIIDSYFLRNIQSRKGQGTLKGLLIPFIYNSTEDPHIVKAFNMIKDNIVLSVTLLSRYGKMTKGILPSDVYMMSAFKLPGDDNIYYHRVGVRLKDKR
jgi:hypothetical protein